MWAGSHEPVDYTNWARSSGEGDTDEPNGGEAENCVFKTLNYVGGSTPGWADYSCGDRYAEGMPCYALCTFGTVPLPTRPSTPAPTTAMPSGGKTVCDGNHDLLHGYCSYSCHGRLQYVFWRGSEHSGGAAQ